MIRRGASRPALVAASWIVIGAAALLAAPADAAAALGRTYHVELGGNDAVGSGQAGAPWRTLARAWDAAGPGDTIVAAPGDYPDASPPARKSGSPGLPITLRAAVPGTVRLEQLRLRGNSHLGFVGLRIQGRENAVSIRSDGPGLASHHLSFRQIGFSCTPGTLNDGACFGMADGTHHVLLEDSWGWGGARYTVACYGGPGGRPPNLTCDNNTFRRVVLRMGPAMSSPGNPQAALSLYYSSRNIVENVIAIDGQAASDTSNAAFYVTAHAPPPESSHNRFLGVMALGNLGAGLWLDCNRAVCTDLAVRDSVFWWASAGAVMVQGGACAGIVIAGNTLGASRGQAGYGNHRCDGATLVNNAIYGNAGHGARQSSSGGSTPTAHHNGYFGNRAGARSGVPSGAGDLASDPAFLHVTRIEASSPYKRAGSGGADIGATVTHRYVDGQLTTVPLWPWPFEERLRAEMCAEPAPGFCSSGKPLTRYVWEYLGNSMPREVEP